MPKIDIPTKRLIQIRPMDWVKAILPEYENAEVAEMKPDKVPKTESKLDSLFWVQKGNQQFILNIEPQGYLDPAMPARMLRYRSDVWEYTISKGIMTPSIKQAVVFFYPHHDNRKHRLEDFWGEERTLDFGYEVVRVWEMKKQPVIEKKLLGLYPLLPLMEQEEEETPDRVMEITVKAIDEVEEAALKADLLAVVSILAGEKFSSELVRKYIRREMLMNSPLFNEWVEEERKEAAQKATISKSKEIIIDQLIAKFDFIPPAIREQLSKVNDQEILDSLLRRIIKITEIEEFEQLIKKVVH